MKMIKRSKELVIIHTQYKPTPDSPEKDSAFLVIHLKYLQKSLMNKKTENNYAFIHGMVKEHT
ncbi:hypothetical protein G159_05015 [Planococcus glaciei CHR43]|nr:hypothetical protein G159_05015 [Planococcus glaciei CHR43]